MDRNLKAFLAVARSGNLTAAAEQIGLTQPALTKAIRRTEQEFGAELFERSVRGMALTQAGRMLFSRSEMIEMHHQQAREEIQLIRDGTLAEFRIAAGTAYHSAVAPDVVKQLSLEYPRMRFRLGFEAANNALPKLMDGEIDLLFGALLSAFTEGIETRPIINVQIIAYASQDSALAQAERVTPADLVRRKWVIYHRDRLNAERLREFCSDHMLPDPEIAMEVDSLVATFRIVAGTDYITLANPYVRDLAERAGLVALRLEQPICSFESGAWYRQSLRDHPALLRAIELARHFAETQISGHS
ncbi:LysR family transcriptional regulator [Solirhodobacter olei]|uniref:LysR family transcriptional regulator n=1 Tax=Solirhodobacter olei TaxID=2493082 RepID=UPI000FD86CC0|nr:LysR family transcriptional regulator [Solirhodobacter olei]